MTGHFFFFVQLSGTNTWYLYCVPATVTVRSRKPVSVFLASAGVLIKEAATTAKRKRYCGRFWARRTTHLQARNCNTNSTKFRRCPARKSRSEERRVGKEG